MFMNTSINESPTICEKAGAPLTGAANLAVKYDANGDVVLAGAGDSAIGILTADTEATVATGDRVTLAIKDIVLWKTGAAVDKGAELAADVAGKAVTAVATDFIVAIALEDAGAANKTIKVQIVKAGYKPA